MRIKMRGRHKFRFVIALFLTILTSVGAMAQQYAVYKVSGNAGVIRVRECGHLHAVKLSRPTHGYASAATARCGL